jgi:hypothetical protein
LHSPPKTATPQRSAKVHFTAAVKTSSIAKPMRQPAVGFNWSRDSVQIGCAGRHRRGREVVEVVQDGARVPSAGQPFPELWCNAGIVLKPAKGIEPGETRNEDDVVTGRATPSRGRFGWHGSTLLFWQLRHFRI